MRQRLSLILIFTLISNSTAFADCDFSKDVQKQPDGSYSYTKDCHVEVGKKINALDKREQQVEKLEKAIELKDLALDKAHERIDLWRETSYKIEDRANTMEQMKKNNEVMYFILGMVVTGLAVYGAGQLK
jgi:hypothetical protein